MSHTTETTVEIRSESHLRRAVPRVGGQILEGKRHSLYGSNRADGVGVRFERWRYPLVFDCDKGTVKYDNFGAREGAMQDLDNLQQAYSQEVLEEVAVTEGHTLEQTETLEDGTLRMVLLCN